MNVLGDAAQNILIVLFNWAGNHPWAAGLVGLWLFMSFTITNVVKALYPSSKWVADNRPPTARALLAIFSPWARIAAYFLAKIGVKSSIGPS